MVVTFDGWRPKLIASRFEEEGGDTESNSVAAKAKKTDGDVTTIATEKEKGSGASASAAAATPKKDSNKKDSKSGDATSAKSTSSTSGNTTKALSVAEEAQAAQALIDAQEAAEVAAKTAETMRIDRMAVIFREERKCDGWTIIWSNVIMVETYLKFARRLLLVLNIEFFLLPFLCTFVQVDKAPILHFTLSFL